MNVNENKNRNFANAKKNTSTHNNEVKPAYGFYSRVLNKPFDSVAELREAEEAYYAEIQAKEKQAAAKKADAKKVEDAFKAMNAARKLYKEKLTQLTKEYSEELTNLKKTFEFGKKDIHNTLAMAEENYAKALKEFTAAHPEGYHVTLRDGDFETTISSQTKTRINKKDDPIMDIFNLFFGI